MMRSHDDGGVEDAGGMIQPTWPLSQNGLSQNGLSQKWLEPLGRGHIGWKRGEVVPETDHACYARALRFTAHRAQRMYAA